MGSYIIFYIDTRPRLCCLLEREVLLYNDSQEVLKNLPKAVNEKEGCDRLILPKIMSRQFPIKYMFLGIVRWSAKHLGFDGKILLECVSEEVAASRLTAHTNFSDDMLINWAITNDDWQKIISEDSVTSNNIVDIVSGTYRLDGAVADQLETYYTTFNLRKSKWDTVPSTG